jgi:hypothetical protein
MDQIYVGFLLFKVSKFLQSIISCFPCSVMSTSLLIYNYNGELLHLFSHLVLKFAILVVVSCSIPCELNFVLHVVAISCSDAKIVFSCLVVICSTD